MIASRKEVSACCLAELVACCCLLFGDVWCIVGKLELGLWKFSEADDPQEWYVCALVSHRSSTCIEQYFQIQNEVT